VQCFGHPFLPNIFVLLKLAAPQPGRACVPQHCVLAIEVHMTTLWCRFFTNRVAFEREQALYSREELRDMMPAVRACVSNSDSHLMTSSGLIFPPFIIVERGEVNICQHSTMIVVPVLSSVMLRNVLALPCSGTFWQSLALGWSSVALLKNAVNPWRLLRPRRGVWVICAWPWRLQRRQRSVWVWRGRMRVATGETERC
jgi:hypothetical protein